MGFFGKLFNWFSGRGWKETEQIQAEQQAVEQERIERQKVEDVQYGVDKSEEPKPQEIVKPEPVQTERPKTPLEQEQEAQKKKLAQMPSRSSVEKQINPDVVNQVNVAGKSFNMNELSNYYKDIYTKNAKLNDPDILNVLIENRGQLQHRFEAKFVFYDEKGYNAELKVSGILVEHTTLIYTLIPMDRQIDYFSSLLADALTQFEEIYGAIGGSISKPVREKTRITEITRDVTFV